MGNRIEAAMLKTQPPLNQTSLAEIMGVTPQAVQQWVIGKTQPRGKRLIALASALNTDVNSLMTDEDDKTSKSIINQNAEWLCGFDDWDSNTPLRDDEVELPYFREVEMGAGSGRCEVLEYNNSKLRFAKSTLKKQGVSAETAACVKVSGNSMEPVLPNGSTIGIDTDKTAIHDGDMYAIVHDGHLRVKMIYKIPGGGLRLRSFNSDEWPDENYTGDATGKIKVLGRVFWYAVLR
jgi:phage repressor protein C with HTH and peptisase S24 domain